MSVDSPMSPTAAAARRRFSIPVDAASPMAQKLAVVLVLTSFIKHRTGTALPDDNGRTLVTTVPRSGGRATVFRLDG